MVKTKKVRATKVGGGHPSAAIDWGFWGGGSRRATKITAETATAISAVYNACTVLSGAVGKLPIHTYRETPGGGKQRDTKDPVYRLFHRRPNKYLTPIELKEMMIWHLLLRGNFFAEKVQLQSGDYELVPLNPDRMTVELTPDGELVYRYMTVGAWVRFEPSEVFHVKGLGSNGKVGRSVIDFAAESLDRSQSMGELASEFFENSASPVGLLKYPQSLTPQSAERLRESWKNSYGVKGKRASVAVLEQGMEWQQVSINNTDSQFLESRKFEIEEIARWFNVPPHKIKHLDRATFSNIEHQGKEFYDDSVLPWTIRIQQSINQSFFQEDQGDRFAEFLYDSLLLTDTKTRYESHNIALNGGWKTRNEIRMLENLNPEDGLDNFMHNLSMGNSGGDAAPEAVVEPTEEPAEDSLELNSKKLKPLFVEHINRIISRESKAVQSAMKGENPLKKLETFYSSSESHTFEVLETLSMSFCSLIERSRGADSLKVFSTQFRQKSQGDVATALSSANPNESIDAMLRNWSVDRVAEESETLMRMLMNGAAYGNSKDTEHSEHRAA
jgi:HK97 family phage portal protein